MQPTDANVDAAIATILAADPDRQLRLAADLMATVSERWPVGWTLVRTERHGLPHVVLSASDPQMVGAVSQAVSRLKTAQN